MSAARRFSRPVLATLTKAGIIGIRSGSEHRFVAVWVIVVKDRVFVRSWNDKPGGWRRAFVEEPRGAIQIPDREIAVRTRSARGARLMASIDLAYAEKYHTPASRKWVTGFAQLRRHRTTLELTPR